MVRCMSPTSLLGCRAHLRILRLTAPGAYLALDDDATDDDVFLLPTTELPADAQVGDELEVFVYVDSEQRLIATTRMPRLVLGEVTFLKVTTVTPIGAFVDWGLGKELLVPFAEQAKELRVGERQPIGLYVDHTGRLAGTMLVGPLLERTPPDGLALDEWVEGEAWRNDPDIGLFVILERSFVGLVPASEPHRLQRGEVARFRITNILPDGKLVLSPMPSTYSPCSVAPAHRASVIAPTPTSCARCSASAKKRSSAPSAGC
jgi:predicted RNA-binding protein (virulence factor B family)